MLLRSPSGSHLSEKQHCPMRQIKAPGCAEESGFYPRRTNNIQNSLTSFDSHCLSHCSSLQSNLRDDLSVFICLPKNEHKGSPLYTKEKLNTSFRPPKNHHITSQIKSRIPHTQPSSSGILCSPQNTPLPTLPLTSSQP